MRELGFEHTPSQAPEPGLIPLVPPSLQLLGTEGSDHFSAH